MKHKVSVVVDKDRSGFYAFCPELPGCQSQGDTLEEVTANIREAVDLYLETLSADEAEQLLSKEIYSKVVEVAVG